MSLDTEFVRWGNGSDQPGAGYRRSKIPGYITSQQFAAFLGVNQGTARDLMRGRHGPALGKLIGRGWFISYETAIQVALERGL